VIRIVGISGSLRTGSFNTALLGAAGRVVPNGTELAAEEIGSIPLYNGDVEIAEGLPARVVELKKQIAAAAGLLLVTPEYNNSIPGVMKNAIDWLSRPPADIRAVFGGKPVALMGATPGPGGTLLAQNAWLPVLRALGTKPWFGPRILVSRVNTAIDQNGNVTDEALQNQLQSFMRGFVEFIGSN
jgi:chromate reductase, NAD(P)H dehydrogenase (quinone)